MEEQRLVRQFDKRTGKTYIYTEERFTDPDTGSARVKRHIVGRLAEDGSIVQTGRRGRPKKKTDPSSAPHAFDTLQAQLVQKDARIKVLEEALADAVRNNEEIIAGLQRQNDQLNRLLAKE